MTHSNVWHRTYVQSTPLTHSHAWHASFLRVTSLIQMCDIGRTFNLPPWLFPLCDMTHSHVQHNSFLRVIWLTEMCGIGRTFTLPPRSIPMCDMTHFNVWYDSFKYMTWNVRSNPWLKRFHVWHDSLMCVTWLIHVCDMTRAAFPTQLFCVRHLYEGHDSSKWEIWGTPQFSHGVSYKFYFSLCCSLYDTKLFVCM